MEPGYYWVRRTKELPWMLVEAKEFQGEIELWTFGDENCYSPMDFSDIARVEITPPEK